MVTTDKIGDYMGRALITPDTDARDFINRATIAGDRDFMGRLLTPVGGGGASTLLDEAAVRFDFSQYTDINDMVDVNGEWGPLVFLGNPAEADYSLTDDGFQMTTTDLPQSFYLQLGFTEPASGPLVFGPDGLTLLSVVRLMDDLAIDVAVSISTELLQANSIGLEGTGYPQGDGIAWTVSGGDGSATASAAFYDAEPTEDEIVAFYSDLPAVLGSNAGGYLAFTVLDVPNQQLRLRLVGPGQDHDFDEPFVKAVPDYAGDPWPVDDFVAQIAVIPVGDPVILSIVQEEYLAWNRALTSVEVDALVAHFSE